MRTQFLFVGLTSLLAGGLVGTAGCDNVTAGQSTDPAGPPQLVHVLVQDSRYLNAFPNRASSLDLIDTGTAPVACSDTPPVNPCLVSFLVDQISPDVSCKGGFCTDPLKVPPTNVPVPLPVSLVGAPVDMRDPGGGIQVRLVFSKVLDTATIETVTMDPTKAPGKTNTYMMAPGIIELDDAAGKPVPSGYYLDNSGSPQFSSDLEFVPLGPALVIKSKVALDAASTYTVKILNPGAIKDRQQNAAVALGGGALPATVTFKTEDLMATASGVFGVANADNTQGSTLDYPDFLQCKVPPCAAGGVSAPATIAPNEVIQIGFFELAAGDTATVTVTGPAGVHAMAYSDRGADATMCAVASAGDPGANVVDVVNTDTAVTATAMAVDWPAGDYTLKITVKDINMKSTFTSALLKFTVAGTDETDPTKDPNIAAAHVLPAQCTMTM